MWAANGSMERFTTMNWSGKHSSTYEYSDEEQPVKKIREHHEKGKKRVTSDDDPEKRPIKKFREYIDQGQKGPAAI